MHDNLSKKKHRRRVVRPASEVKAQSMVDRLRKQHALGIHAVQAQKDGRSTTDVAAEHGYSEHTMRKIKAFARRYSQNDLEELCRCRREHSGLPLHWGYIPTLLAIEGRHGLSARKRFQKAVLNNNWTVPELRRAIREELGFSGHGRTAKLPQKPSDGLMHLVESIEILQRRCLQLIEKTKKGRKKVMHRKCQRLLTALGNARKVAT